MVLLFQPFQCSVFFKSLKPANFVVYYGIFSGYFFLTKIDRYFFGTSCTCFGIVFILVPYLFNTENSLGLNRGNDLDRVMTGFPVSNLKKWAKAHTIKYGTRIKTIPKHVQLVPKKYRSIFVKKK
jgi:hypothetical protein